ncbi:hypothetical protein TcYC6_0037450 [Trypanosoma cruzi]|nr:hypothetical protein TcYC6_0037450 [Trypanosoma cruzi]
MLSRTVSPTPTEQGLPRASVPVAESIETDRGTPPKDVDLAAPQKHPLTEEKKVASGTTTGDGVISPSDTAGAPQEAKKKSGHPDNDDVAADGVTSFVGQSTGDEAVSNKANGSTTFTKPKSPDAADDAQGAVDPPPREDGAAVGRGDWEEDMKYASPRIHRNNTAAAACPFPLLLLLAAAAAVPTLY